MRFVGDGAGAAVLSRKGNGPSFLALGVERTGASHHCFINLPAEALKVLQFDTVEKREHYLKMNGREIFKSAVRVMETASRELLSEHNIQPSEVDHFIPHQANVRIVESLANRLEECHLRNFCNLDKHGNTSAASIPLALDEASRSGIFKPGQLGLMVAFGAGLTWSSTLVRF